MFGVATNTSIWSDSPFLWFSEMHGNSVGSNAVLGKSRQKCSHKSVFYYLYQVSQLSPYFDCADFATLIHASITLRLDYCNMLHVGLPLKTVQKF